MWNRLSFIRNIKCMYLSSLQPASKETCQRNTQLTHRFVDYLQTIQAGDKNTLVKSLNEMKEMRSLSQLDNVLCNKASNLSNNAILQYLTFCMLQSPNEVTKLQFYSVSRSILAHRLTNNRLTPQQIVHFMFMLALKKRNYTASKYINGCMLMLEKKKSLQNLSLMDLLIICNATFKTSTKISNTSILTRLQENLFNNLSLLEDPGMFITLVKTFRHNMCQTDELLATISATIFFNMTYKYYTFTAISHILPLYADCLYYDEQLFNLFTQCAIDQLKQSEVLQKDSYFTDSIRGKDIKRFLWSCYFIGHVLSDKDKLIFADKIRDRLLMEHYDDEPDTLFDSVFYLWMLQCCSEELLNACKNKIHIIRQMPNKTKIRVNILLICLRIENLSLYKTFGHKPDAFKMDKKKEFQRRPHLIRVYNILKQILIDLDVNRLEYEYQVPHINIMGITGYRKNIYKAFVVDVLDDTNSAKNITGHASGPMKLKLHMMYKMDLNVILLNFKEFKDFSDLDLIDYLRKEVSIVS